MGFSSGKSKSKSVSGPSRQQTTAANLLLESIVPGSVGAQGYSRQQEQQPVQQMQTQTGLPYEGPGGVSGQGTFQPAQTPDASKVGQGTLEGFMATQRMADQGAYTSSIGTGREFSGQPLGPDAVTRTLLPSLDQMRFKGTFDQLDEGQLSPTAADIIQEGANLAKDPLGTSQQAAAQIDTAVQEGQVTTLPELPEITNYINKVYEDMPTPLKNVIDDFLQGGTTEKIEESIQQNVAAIKTQAEDILKDQLDITFGKFASMGATGGAMFAAAGDVTTQVMGNVSASIAGFYAQALTQAQQQQQLALQTLSTVIGTAGQQQALDAQRQAIELDTTTKLISAKYNLYAGLTQEFLRQNQFYTDIVRQETQAANQQEFQAMSMFYEILTSLATGGPGVREGTTRQSQFTFGL